MMENIDMFMEDNEELLFTSSSSDDEDDSEILANLLLVKEKRCSITEYVTKTVVNYSDKEFITHFRINRETYEKLLFLYQNSIEYSKIKMSAKAKGGQHELLLFLWFAGHEACSYRDLADRFDVTISSVHRMIGRVTMFISKLASTFIRWPTEQAMDITSQFYLSKFKFPGVFGSIDGTHIRIDPPSANKDNYISRKGVIALHLQGICNEEKKFINIFIGYPASVHDARVLANSMIGKKLPSLSKDKYLLGDSAYPCTSYLMTPYKNNGHLTTKQKNFNYMLSQCRADIENTFGILKQRFRQLYYCKLRGVKFICHFIRACCVLHNMSKIEDIEGLQEQPPFDETFGAEEERDEISKNLESEVGKAIRERIAQELPPAEKKKKI